MAFLLQWLELFGTWLWNALTTLPLVILNDLLQGIITFLDGIPVPSFFGEVGGWVAAVPPLAAWFIQALQIPAGIEIISTALFLRFLLRRIP